MSIIDFTQDKNKIEKYIVDLTEDNSSKFMINIQRKIIYEKKGIIYDYKIDKYDLYKKISQKIPYILSEDFNINFALCFISGLSPNDFSLYFKNFLINITYIQNKNNNALLNKNGITFNDNVNIAFKEIFLHDKHKIHLFSYIYENDILIGYGLFDSSYEKHYIFLSDKNDFFNSSIYLNGNKITKANLDKLNDINFLIERTFKEYFKTAPVFDITGNYLYIKIKLYILNILKQNNLDFKIVENIEQLNSLFLKKEDKDAIIIIKYNRHMSILLKLDETFYSLDTSKNHYEFLIKSGNFDKNNLLCFDTPIQNGPSCSFYSIKFIEVLMNMAKRDIIQQFKSGELLMKVVLSMGIFLLESIIKNIYQTKKMILILFPRKLY